MRLSPSSKRHQASNLKSDNLQRVTQLTRGRNTGRGCENRTALPARGTLNWVPLLGTGRFANVLSSLSNLEISHPSESS